MQGQGKWEEGREGGEGKGRGRREGKGEEGREGGEAWKMNVSNLVMKEKKNRGTVDPMKKQHM